MVSGVGFGIERIGLAALAYPKVAATFLLAMLLVIGLSVPRVAFDDDIHRVFMSDSSLSQAQRAYEAQQTPPTSMIVIYINSATPLEALQMMALRDLALDLEFVDGVTGVSSPFVLRWPPESGAPSGTPLFGPQIGTDFDVDLRAFNALGTGIPTFLNIDLTAMMLGVSIDTDRTRVPDAVAAIGTALNRSMPPDLSAQITGEDAISAEIVSGLKDDLVALNLWGALAVTLAAFALLRDLRMALLAVVPALIGALAVLALSVWLAFPLTVLSNVIPILLLVLGVANGVHLAGHFKQDGSVRGAIETVGPACGLTALTTALAFGSIMLTGNAQLFEFAVLGAMGTLLAFVLVLVTFALLARMMPLSKRPVPPMAASFAQHLTLLGTKWPHLTLVICAALLAVSTVGFLQTKAWFPLYQNLPDTSATVATNDAIADDFGGVFQMIVETESGWEQTSLLVAQLEALPGAHTVLSEVNFARWLAEPDVRPDTEALARLPQALTASLRTAQGGSRIFVSVPEPMRSPETLAAFDTLYAAAQAGGASQIIGLPVVMRQEAVRLIDQLSLGLIVAAFGATGLCALAFRSARLLPVLIIPNILPLMLTGASLHLWMRAELSPVAVLALTIAFGIAIDDTVHFLSRFAAARARGDAPERAIVAAAGTAGEVMVLTTLLLTAGLSVTLLSDFTPIRLFGGMMIVTLWAALLVDLLLLPALLTRKGSADVLS